MVRHRSAYARGERERESEKERFRRWLPWHATEMRAHRHHVPQKKVFFQQFLSEQEVGFSLCTEIGIVGAREIERQRESESESEGDSRRKRDRDTNERDIHTCIYLSIYLYMYVCMYV